MSAGGGGAPHRLLSTSGNDGTATVEVAAAAAAAQAFGTSDIDLIASALGLDAADDRDGASVNGGSGTGAWDIGNGVSHTAISADADGDVRVGAAAAAAAAPGASAAAPTPRAYGLFGGAAGGFDSTDRGAAATDTRWAAFSAAQTAQRSSALHTAMQALRDPAPSPVDTAVPRATPYPTPSTAAPPAAVSLSPPHPSHAHLVTHKTPADIASAYLRSVADSAAAAVPERTPTTREADAGADADADADGDLERTRFVESLLLQFSGNGDRSALPSRDVIASLASSVRNAERRDASMHGNGAAAAAAAMDDGDDDDVVARPPTGASRVGPSGPTPTAPPVSSSVPEAARAFGGAASASRARSKAPAPALADPALAGAFMGWEADPPPLSFDAAADTAARAAARETAVLSAAASGVMDLAAAAFASAGAQAAAAAAAAPQLPASPPHSAANASLARWPVPMTLDDGVSPAATAGDNGESAHTDERKRQLDAQRLAYEMKFDAFPDATHCKVCLSEPLSAVLLPCAHVCVCIDCAQRLTACPNCRGTIASFQAVAAP